MVHVQVSVHDSELHSQLVQFLKTAFADHLTVEADKPFIIGYSGGSMPKSLIPVIETAIDRQHHGELRFFPVDERLVPINHADNNSGVYLKQLKQLFNEDQFALLPESVLNDSEKAAEFLRQKLSEWSGETENGWPRINVLFLGMGPDGHTCSLFPNHPLLKETKKWTVPIEDSPKPPPRRVTITVPVINAAQHVAFIVLGEEKADVLEVKQFYLLNIAFRKSLFANQPNFRLV
jgi:6-phosphogluconolactonase